MNHLIFVHETVIVVVNSFSIGSFEYRISLLVRYSEVWVGNSSREDTLDQIAFCISWYFIIYLLCFEFCGVNFRFISEVKKRWWWFMTSDCLVKMSDKWSVIQSESCGQTNCLSIIVYTPFLLIGVAVFSCIDCRNNEEKGANSFQNSFSLRFLE